MNNQHPDFCKALEVLEVMGKAYKTKDMQLMMSLFSSDPDTILIGSGIDEKRTGPQEIMDQFQRDWEQSLDNEFMPKNSQVFFSDNSNIAWIYTDLLLKSRIMQSIQSFELRFTLVLEKKEGRYFIRHSHISFPCAWQPEGESYPL